MTRLPKLRAAYAAALAIALTATLAPAATSAAAGLLEPPGKKVYFGVSDTGDPASFGQFSTAVSHDRKAARPANTARPESTASNTSCTASSAISGSRSLRWAKRTR